MPGPEPGTVWIEEYEGRLLSTFIPYFSWPPGSRGPQNRNRRNRAIKMTQRYAWGMWVCQRCVDELSPDKRTDTLYCRESCRKRAARARRARRSGNLEDGWPQG